MNAIFFSFTSTLFQADLLRPFEGDSIMFNRLTAAATGTLTGTLLTGAVLTGAILMAKSVQAQTSPIPQSQGAIFLDTQPAGIRAMEPKPLDRAAQLNQVADSLQPQTSAPTSGILSKLSTSGKTPAAVDPLDFFRVPGMNGSVKMPLESGK
jgi:hypothetical protein